MQKCLSFRKKVLLLSLLLLIQKINIGMKRVLVAEDNDSNWMLMTYVLKRNYEPVRAHNGEEAVKMALTGEYALVIMDLKMPVMDGLDATRQIKMAMPDLPVIALTANAFDSDRQAAFEAGCDNFMSKPVSADSCLKMIADYIG
jgi:CheY-like chemotaxis protein